LEVLVNKFSHTRFEPMGHTNNPDVRFAKSVVDYIFRWLGLTFLASYREEQKAKAELLAGSTPDAAAAPASAAPTAKPGSNITTSPVNGNGAEVQSTSSYTKAKFVGLSDAPPVWNVTSTPTREDSRDAQFAKFQGDAPACDSCGAVTVRNGNCYLCHNCGNSLGCS
jgi:ribonucleoside-diphosphate reductase alpha chain